MQNHIKIVDFDQYCNTCKHLQVDGDNEPCFECLTNPSNIDSRKPIMYEKK